jgi:hypothetical protein
MQIVIPLVMTLAIMGNPTELQIASGTLIGKIPAGTDTYLQNAGYVWLILLIFFGKKNEIFDIEEAKLPPPKPDNNAKI